MSVSIFEDVVSFLEDFREEVIARIAFPDVIIESWTSKEPQVSEDRATFTPAITTTDQLRALFLTVSRGTPEQKSNFYLLLKQKEPELMAELEQRFHNSKLTQTELTWTRAKPQINIESKKAKIVRQKQLINQIIKETGTIWKGRQVEKEAFHILNKATRLMKEIEQLWEAMEQEESQQKCVIDTKKHYIEEMHARVQRERSEIDQIKCEIQEEKAKLELDRHNAKVELDKLNILRETIDKQNKELDEKLSHTKRQSQEMEVTSAETAIRKQDLVKTMRANKRKEEELSRMKEEMVQETKTRTKWMNFQLQKRERHLDRRLERIMRERDELDIMKINVSRQRQELQRRMEEMLAKMMTVTQVKDGMETTAAELDSTREEMYEVQKMARESKEQVNRYVVSNKMGIIH